jgi:hypothetical protein
MSLLDRAKYQIKSITNLTSTTVSYGLIGISTIILGYYTFFENDIEIPAPEVPIETPSTEQPSIVPTEQPSIVPTEQPSTEQPSTEQPSIVPTEQPSTEPQKQVSFFGGKKKKNRFA